MGGYFAGVSTFFGRASLVEPFSGKNTLKYPVSASILKPSTLLHPVVDDDPKLRTDERAVRRRDYAHYVSHGFFCAIVCAAFILEFGSKSNLQSGIANFGLRPSAVNHIVYFLLQIGYISSMTLPQAILLWTEPDMERESEPA